MYKLTFKDGLEIVRQCTTAQIRQYIELNGLVSYKKLFKTN